MKENGLKFLSVIIVLCTVAGICSSCANNNANEDIKTTNRPVTISQSTSKTVKTTNENIVAIAPEGDEEILKYFNTSLKIFRNSTFDFTKKDSCKMTSYSAGSLNNINGATASYKSTLKSAIGDMMGVYTLESAYFAGDDISEVFAIKELTVDDINSAKATAEGSKVTVEFSVKQNAADGSDAVSLLTKNYMTSESFKQKISGYGATADSATARVTAVTLKAVIDYSTKNFVDIEIGYNTTFSVAKISLDYVSGGPVNGSTKTTIKYTDFKEI